MVQFLQTYKMLVEFILRTLQNNNAIPKWTWKKGFCLTLDKL